jgi:hypothetical protein
MRDGDKTGHYRGIFATCARALFMEQRSVRWAENWSPSSEPSDEQLASPARSLAQSARLS